MTTCSKHRPGLALLASGESAGETEAELRAHIASCAECRQYFAELSNLTRELREAPAHNELLTSEKFHRNLMQAIRAEASSPLGKLFRAGFWKSFGTWRVALPALSAAAVLVVAAILLNHSPENGVHFSPGPQAVAMAKPGQEMVPTVSYYELLASRSLEKLDEVLTAQGARNPSPLASYTAASLSQREDLD
ncbi:MAG TPA: hypothetical protein VGE41_03590 [Verrucomicrobiae bacterium]|jgi:anti-sigma-K factor RskA